MTKTYKETKKAMQELINIKGQRNIKNSDLNNLKAEGHTLQNILKANAYFYTHH